jgi:hypothetical protein
MDGLCEVGVVFYYEVGNNFVNSYIEHSFPVQSEKF